TEDEVELTVADTGTGMSDNILSQVFQPFFSTKDKGLGLGLNIVHKIVKEHGGYVFISSKIGEGTQIQINFPVKFEVYPVERLTMEDKDVRYIRYTGS
ncbi:MAG: HAMP domain-containing sensor histidine kinase, partial [Nitrospirota bacterium]